MKIKKGVSISGIGPEISLGIHIVESILNKYGQELVITSCMEGKHKRGSAHYRGDAVDLRIWTLINAEECIKECREALGDDFDIILEGNHIHLEFDPKLGANL